MVFGTFDGLHEGHQYFLREARKLGDLLIAVVARDETVQELKRKNPKHLLHERIEAIRNVALADEVIPGDAMQESWDALRKYEPAVIALGYDQNALYSALSAALPKFSFRTEIRRIARM